MLKSRPQIEVNAYRPSLSGKAKATMLPPMAAQKTCSATRSSSPPRQRGADERSAKARAAARSTLSSVREKAPVFFDMRFADSVFGAFQRMHHRASSRATESEWRHVQRHRPAAQRP